MLPAKLLLRCVFALTIDIRKRSFWPWSLHLPRTYPQAPVSSDVFTLLPCSAGPCTCSVVHVVQWFSHDRATSYLRTLLIRVRLTGNFSSNSFRIAPYLSPWALVERCLSSLHPYFAGLSLRQRHGTLSGQGIPIVSSPASYVGWRIILEEVPLVGLKFQKSSGWRWYHPSHPATNSIPTSRQRAKPN